MCARSPRASAATPGSRGRSSPARRCCWSRTGAAVAHCFVVFHYGIFPEAEESLASEGVRLHALATWHDVIAEAERSRRLTPAALAEVRRYLADPKGWT